MGAKSPVSGGLPVGRLSSIVRCRGSTLTYTMCKILLLAILLTHLPEIEGKQPGKSRSSLSIVMKKTGSDVPEPINSVRVNSTFYDQIDSVVVGSKYSNQSFENRSTKSRESSDGLSFKTDRLTVGTLEGFSTSEELSSNDVAATHRSSVLTNDSSTAQPSKRLKSSLKNLSKVRFLRNRRIAALQISPQTEKQTNNENVKGGIGTDVITSEVNMSRSSINLPYIAVINKSKSDFSNTTSPSILISGEAREDPINDTYAGVNILVTDGNKSTQFTEKIKTAKILFQDDNDTQTGEENTTKYYVLGEDGDGLDLNYSTYEDQSRVSGGDVKSGQNQVWLISGHVQASSLATEENNTDQNVDSSEKFDDFGSVALSELVNPTSIVNLSHKSHNDPLKKNSNENELIQVNNWTQNFSFLNGIITSTTRQRNVVNIETRTTVSMDTSRPLYLNETTRDVEHFFTSNHSGVVDESTNIREAEEPIATPVRGSKYLDSENSRTTTKLASDESNNTTDSYDIRHQKNAGNPPPGEEYQLSSGFLQETRNVMGVPNRNTTPCLVTDPLRTLETGSSKSGAYTSSSLSTNFPNTHNLFIDGATISSIASTTITKLAINGISSLQEGKSSATTPNPTIPTSTITTMTNNNNTQSSATQQSLIDVVRIAGVMRLTKGIQWSPKLGRKYTKDYIRLSQTLKELIQDTLLQTSFGNRLIDVIINRFSPGGVVVEFCLMLKQVRTTDDARFLSEVFNAGLGTNNTLGNFSVDPCFTDFKVLTITRTGTIREPPIPQWAIAVIVISAASLIFLCLFSAVTVYGRHQVRQKYGSRLEDEEEVEFNHKCNYKIWQNEVSEGYENLAGDEVSKNRDISLK